MDFRCDQKGITLVELLVVIVIIGILAAVAIPTYTGYMQRARRVDAKTALEQLRASQEMRRAERGSYSTDLTELRNTWGFSNTRVGDYDVSFTAATGTAFTARARPWNARQSSDGDLFINNLGDKTPAAKWSK
jgi:type IV pilus assembly protein PilE